MAKFRIRLKLQALELEVDGERDDIPAITSAVQTQLGGLVQSAAETAGNTPSFEAGHPTLTLDAHDAKPNGRRSRKRGGSPRPTGDGASSQPLEFRHDPSKYGSPQQSWSVIDKCVWLLFVIQETTGTKEVGGPQLASTFNGQFKHAGKIHPPHVTRDLGRAKIQVRAMVGEDKGLWFLTDEGKRHARSLIEKLSNQPSL